MRDIYLYEGTDVLKNLLNIRDRKLLDEAEADYVTYRLKEIAMDPLPEDYDYMHLLFSRGIKGYKPRISPFTQITVLLPIWKDRSRHRFPTGGLMKSVRILRSSRGNADLSVLR